MSEAPGDAGRAELYRFALEQGQRAVDQQVESLEAVRTRSGTLLGAASVVGALMVSVLFDLPIGTDRPGAGLEAGGVWALTLAGASLAAVGALTVYVWWPTKGVFALDPAVIITGYVDGSPPADEEERIENWPCSQPSTGARTSSLSTGV